MSKRKVHTKINILINLFIFIQKNDPNPEVEEEEEEDDDDDDNESRKKQQQPPQVEKKTCISSLDFQ
jgi:hypothetical protein